MKYTDQELFDKIAIHLLKQNQRSMNDTGGCVYHHKDTGNYCAVGCLFKDTGIDTDEFEGIGIHSVIHSGFIKDKVKLLKSALDKIGITSNQYEILDYLQGLHDNVSVDLWYDNLMFTAKLYNLSTKAIEGFKK
jgi:hypothetical protein